ncbi:MAG: Uncharacterized protein HW380_1887 [Magnetococcales bacterium]|nr:Uncharacterized protein [Magnetococcales bacterium]
MKQAVFLSASVPDPVRTPQYADSDPMAIRDAVVGLAMETSCREIPLIYGGHPSITVFLARWAERTGRVDHVILYQSRYYEESFLPEIRTISCLKLVDWVDGGEKANLTHFRHSMVSENDIMLGVFMGGMVGLQEELDILRQHHPKAVVMPLMHLGGQTRDLFSNEPLAAVIQEANVANVSPGGRFAHVLDKMSFGTR